MNERLQRKPIEYFVQRTERVVRACPNGCGCPRWAAAVDQVVPPQSVLGKAISYAINRLPALEVYLNHPLVPIDNNRVENSIRGFAVGRRNCMEHFSPAEMPWQSLMPPAEAAARICASNSIASRFVYRLFSARAIGQRITGMMIVTFSRSSRSRYFRSTYPWIHPG